VKAETKKAVEALIDEAMALMMKEGAMYEVSQLDSWVTNVLYGDEG
jgi:hypothetical protein